jgi:hypothetical protein
MEWISELCWLLGMAVLEQTAHCKGKEPDEAGKRD